MKKETECLIVGILFGITVLGCVWIVYTHWKLDVQEAQQQLNQTITNATIKSYWAGVYDVALEQTKTGNIYYLNSTGGLNFKSIGELCKNG